MAKEDPLRGMILGDYTRAYRAGARASSNSSQTAERRDGRDKIDVFWDRYCKQAGINYQHPKAQAWMDGWVNFDTPVTAFLDLKQEEIDA